MRAVGLAAGIAVCGLLSLCAAGDEVRLRVGIVSDIHLGNDRSKAVFVRALAFFREQNVDAVLIPGDMTYSASPAEWQRVTGAWQEVFPDDRAPDGHTVERLFVTGNHDASLRDPAKAWPEMFRNEYAPVWIRKVRGYAFVGAQWGCTKGLAEFYRAHDAELRGDRPFFHIQHAHPHGTCLGDWAGGNEPCATAVLTNYPNAVAFSGHSHYPLTDERSIWQGAFTSVNAGSLSHECHEYNMRDNAKVNSYGFTAVQPERLTPVVGLANCKPGLVMTVTDRCIRLARYSFGEKKPRSLGEDWVFPVGPDAPKPYAFATRAAGRSAPEFAADAAVTCTACTEKPENGAAVSCVKVVFPPARTVGGCRVFDYEVTASLVGDDVALPIRTKRVFAPAYHLPESMSDRPGGCLFAATDFPANARLRFSVRPLECFGKAGKAISADIRFARADTCTVKAAGRD